MTKIVPRPSRRGIFLTDPYRGERYKLLIFIDENALPQSRGAVIVAEPGVIAAGLG
jgi:hypothetical protein